MKYQISDEQIEIDRLVASLYNDEKTGASAIVWFVQQGEIIAPVELQQESDNLTYWQRLLCTSPDVEIELLVKPVDGGDSRYSQHPIVKTFQGIAQTGGKSVPSGEVAERLNPLSVTQALSGFGFHGNIDWSYFPAKAKMLELIKRQEFFRVGVGALCQGIVYLSGSRTIESGFEPGSLASVQRPRYRSGGQRHRHSVNVGGRTYRSRR